MGGARQPGGGIGREGGFRRARRISHVGREGNEVDVVLAAAVEESMSGEGEKTDSRHLAHRGGVE